MTHKARFIETNSALSPKEQEQALTFFTRYPNYENRIDWNRKLIPFDEFERVFTLAENSARSQKKKMRMDPRAMLAAHNCPVIGEAENFLIAVPLDWQAAVFCNSFRCGGQGARWCIGNSKSPVHWEYHVGGGGYFYYFIYFKKEDPTFGKKIMIKGVGDNVRDAVYFQNNYSTDFELLEYYFNANTIKPVEPEGQFDFDPAARLAKLLGRPVHYRGMKALKQAIEHEARGDRSHSTPAALAAYIRMEALKHKVRGDRSRGTPTEAITAYTRALELGYHKARADRALVYAKIGQKKKALTDLLVILYPDLKKKPSVKHYLELIKNFYWAFNCLPEKYKTEEFCFAVVKMGYIFFSSVPKKYRTAELCLEAVRQDVNNCKYVPKKYRTAELCLAAVRHDYRALDYVPKKYITVELCLEALKNLSCDTIFNYVPEKVKPDLALALVRKNGLFLVYVPEEHITAEICLEAVRKTGMALELVPKKYKTPELCFESVKTKKESL